jgi:hypothetical protein
MLLRCDSASDERAVLDDTADRPGRREIAAGPVETVDAARTSVIRQGDPVSAAEGRRTQTRVHPDDELLGGLRFRSSRLQRGDREGAGEPHEEKRDPHAFLG